MGAVVVELVGDTEGDGEGYNGVGDMVDSRPPPHICTTHLS